MSFVKKIKDILFEEEDEPTREIRTEEKPVSEPKIVRIESLKDRSFDFEEESEPVREPYKEPYKEPVKEEVKKEAFRSDNTFTFPDFDEEEFASSMSRGRQNTNVLEYERKIKEDKRDYSRLEKVENARDDRKKFKPSPIISPVYGILNQDYKAEDIVNRGEVASNINIDEVRKKAFEPVKEVEMPQVKHEDVIDEPVVTFFGEKESVEVKDDYKTIDDLLEEASTEVPLEDTLEIPANNNLDAIEEELEKLDEEEKTKPIETKKDEDLDNDLFELIDSMYDDREEV